MATAKRLPSGAWRVRAYVYTDKDGVRHYQSFTAATKREAEKMALNVSKPDLDAVTFYGAARRYIDIRSSVLSPRSISTYESYLKLHVQELMQMKVCHITQADIQRAINREALDYSPKSIRSVHGFIAAVMGTVRPEFVLHTALPKMKRPNINLPSEDDVAKLIRIVKGTQMYLPILLAAFGPMRRGEICALRAEDISGSVVHVCRNKVKKKNPDGSSTWIVKAPKSYAGDRYIDYPDFVREAWEATGIASGEFIRICPDALTNRYTRIMKSSGLPYFRFHDLRHYSASIQHALGVPDVYIMQRGGWGSDTTLKQVYRHAMSSEAKRQRDIINSHFTEVYDTAKDT